MNEMYLEVDIKPSDFWEIVAKVRDADPMVSTPTNLADMYDLKAYVEASLMEEYELQVHMDLNVLTRVCALVDSPSVTSSMPDGSSRLTAAIMCFLILGGFDVNPFIALYEFAAKETHEKAMVMLKNFEVADHIHPQDYADLALGRTNSLPATSIEHARKLAGENPYETQENNFTKTLISWRINYHALLKFHSIRMDCGDSLESVIRFVNWMVGESFTSITRLFFGILSLSPNRPKNIIKKIDTANHEKLLGSLRNSAWDMTHINEWAKTATKTTASNRSYFLCSNDKVVRMVARSILAPCNGEGEDEIYVLLREHWTDELARQITSILRESEQKTSTDATRHAKLPCQLKELAGEIEFLENHITSKMTERLQSDKTQ